MMGMVMVMVMMGMVVVVMMVMVMTTVSHLQAYNAVIIGLRTKNSLKNLRKEICEVME